MKESQVVLTNKNKALGEPHLHYFVGGGYTGSLAFENTPNGIYVYQNANHESDCLLLIDASGEFIETVQLPQMLVWDIQYYAATDSMLLDIDHHIFEYRLADKTFNQLADRKTGNWASFISVADEKTAFATDCTIFIRDNQKQILFQQKFVVETINGVTSFCAKLSPSGNTLAFHNKVGEIRLLNANDGTFLQTIAANFQMVEQIEFAENEKLLVIREKFGEWKVGYFDLETNQEVKFETLEIPEYTKQVNSFCFNSDQSKLVLVQRSTAYVFDFIHKKLLHSFKIYHCVKRANVKFVGDILGVRTDYGCFSLYNV